MKNLFTQGVLILGGTLILSPGYGNDSNLPAQNTLWTWFPSEQVQMGKMIAQIDQLGSVAIQPNALVRQFPVSNWVQDFKTDAAKKGFYYVFHTAYMAGAIDNKAPGMESFEQFFASTFAFRWNVLSEKQNQGTWINFQLDSQYAVGQKNPGKATMQSGTGTATKPNNGLSYPMGSYIKELAVAQSFMDGDSVLIFGLPGQSNYFDVNRYAGTQYGMFLNSAFCNSTVFPAASNNLGVILQYQFNDNFYGMVGMGSNNTQLGDNPFTDLSWDNVSYLMEFGWTHEKAFGIGKGTYKLQPFFATVQGETQPGIALNASQDLGNSPFALFGRAGVGGSQATSVNGAQAQVSGGLVIKRPLALMGLVEEDFSNFFGIAGVWTKTASSVPGNSGLEETAVEFNYSIQLTPTIIVQPNFQMYFNPAYNTAHNYASVFQLQVSVNW